MANVTDNLVQAEEFIKGIMDKPFIDRALDTCQWLLSFNNYESFKIKCYTTGGERPDVRFCIDRGSDCWGLKIRTGFVVIERDYSLMGLYSSNPQTYFKPDQKKWRINSTVMASLPMVEIRQHILESYCIKIKEIGLDSVMCNRKDSISMESESSDAEIPTREDVERLLRSLHGEVDEDVFKAAVVAAFTKEGRTLNPGWWEITKRNLMEWSKNSLKNSVDR